MHLRITYSYSKDICQFNRNLTQFREKLCPVTKSCHIVCIRNKDGTELHIDQAEPWPPLVFKFSFRFFFIKLNIYVFLGVKIKLGSSFIFW
jgi:hypothetical protein